jgi:hypothetical protein
MAMDTESNQPALKAFMDTVLSIDAAYGDIIANGIPGMGQPNAGAQAVDSLRRAATSFARAYRSPAVPAATVRQLADELEAALQLVATLGAVTDTVADTVTAELRQLMISKQETAQ